MAKCRQRAWSVRAMGRPPRGRRPSSACPRSIRGRCRSKVWCIRPTPRAGCTRRRPHRTSTRRGTTSTGEGRGIRIRVGAYTAHGRCRNGNRTATSRTFRATGPAQETHRNRHEHKKNKDSTLNIAEMGRHMPRSFSLSLRPYSATVHARSRSWGRSAIDFGVICGEDFPPPVARRKDPVKRRSPKNADE